MNEHASWIWSGTDAHPTNDYRYFRKVVEAGAGEVLSARFEVSADTAFRLYVNGSLVGHGPARSDPRHKAYDVLDLKDVIVPGKNVIAALVCFEGVGTCADVSMSPGFLLQGELRIGNSVTQVSTDGTWRTAPAPYSTAAERISIQLPYPEIYDACSEPVGWNGAGFDDSAWELATVVCAAGKGPWTGLEPRDIPYARSFPVTPERIVSVTAILDGTDAASAGTPAARMEAATSLAPKTDALTYTDSPADFTIAPQTEGSGVSVLIDFDREVSGFPSLEIGPSRGGSVDIGYVERLEDDGTADPNRAAGLGVHYADALRFGAAPAAWRAFHHRAFRYLRLDFRECPDPVKVHVGMEYSAYPVGSSGAFLCSDPLLNRIWEVGRYTAELCMDDGFMDCPLRERGQWLADARVEALIAAYAFGDHALARRAWRQYAHGQGTTDGFGGQGEAPAHYSENWVKCVYPSRPEFDTVLPTFNCIWLDGVWEYFLQSGDHALLRELWPHVEQLTRTLERYEGADHLLTDLPGWVFVDWAAVDVRGAASHVNAFYYSGLLAAGRIARAVGNPERGAELEFRASEVKESINEAFFDRSIGLYRDCRVDGELQPTVSEQANVLCALYGIADAGVDEAILERLLQPDADPTAEDGTPIVRIATPYFAFYLMRALYGSGRHEQALDYTRTHWGDMLTRGATTFWEQYEPYWSLCHAWSAAPTYDLPSEIAGIKPLQPGFEEAAIDVNPAGLTWFRSTVPTVRGDITVAYHYRTNETYIDAMGGSTPPAIPEPAVSVYVEIPTGVEAYLSVPLADAEGPVTINGEAISGTHVAVQGVVDGAVAISEGRLQAILQPGTYAIEARR